MEPKEIIRSCKGNIETQALQHPNGRGLCWMDYTIYIFSMSGINQLMAKLIYGSGLRLMEYIQLGVRDTPFDGRHRYPGHPEAAGS
jgi:integrase